MSAESYTREVGLAEPTLWKQFLTTFQLFYGIASFILMSFVFVHLAKSPHYSNSFYRLVQVDLIINTVCWCNTWIAVRAMDLVIGQKYLKFLETYLPGIWSTSVFIANFFFHMQFCSAAAMAVHRITAILFFSNYDEFWRRWYLLVNFLFIVYSIIPQLGGLPSKLSLVNDTLYITRIPELQSVGSKRLVIFSVIYIVLLLAIGITVARIAFKKLQQIQGSNADQAISRKLTKIALTYGILYSGILVYTIVSFIHFNIIALPAALFVGFLTLVSIASDMITLSLPYVLLIYDSNIQRNLLHPFQKTNVVPVVPSQSQST